MCTWNARKDTKENIDVIISSKKAFAKRRVKKSNDICSKQIDEGAAWAKISLRRTEHFVQMCILYPREKK